MQLLASNNKLTIRILFEIRRPQEFYCLEQSSLAVLALFAPRSSNLVRGFGSSSGVSSLRI